jgi:hypothetical protein
VELDSEHNLKIVIPGALVGLGVLAFLAFGVHTKFIDDKVSEDGPVFERGAVGTEPVEEPAIVALSHSLPPTSPDLGSASPMPAGCLRLHSNQVLVKAWEAPFDLPRRASIGSRTSSM